MVDKPRESPAAERVASGCPSRGTHSQHVVDTKNSKSETRNPKQYSMTKIKKSPKTKRNLLQSPVNISFGCWKSLIHAGWGRRIRSSSSGRNVLFLWTFTNLNIGCRPFFVNSFVSGPSDQALKSEAVPGCPNNSFLFGHLSEAFNVLLINLKITILGPECF